MYPVIALNFSTSLTHQLLIALALCLVGCASPNEGGSDAMNSTRSLEQLAIKHKVCGAAIARIKGRKLDSIETASGCVPKMALNPDSIFQAASLSKPVFAYAVLKLVAQRKLELDAPVVKYLPEGYRHQPHPFEGTESAKTELVTDSRLKSVTVRMVLNHTSGLPNWAQGSLRFESEPGAKWQYSGEGYLLLQRAVEAVSGESLDHFMTAQVFKPLGMHHSSFIWEQGLEQNEILMASMNGTLTKPRHFVHPVAAASLYTSVADYGKFLVTVLNDAPLLKQITDSAVVVDPNLNLKWGLGWGIEDDKSDLLIWQWGNNPGYRGFAIASTRSGDGFVMLTNSGNGLALAEPITNAVLPTTHKIFQFSMLPDGFTQWMCRTTGFCF